jgi:putative DNA primase/helicase
MSIHNVHQNFTANDSIPQELRHLRQWVCWRWEWNTRKKKWDKVPIDPKMGSNADVKDAAMWGSFKEACAYASEHYLDGVGFVFTPDDPYCGVDLDASTP